MIGSEYAHFAIKPKKTIPEDLSGKKIEKVWNNKTKSFIDYDSYKAVGDKLFKAIEENTAIKTTYDAFKDTSWFERYTQNAYQFSSAKDLAETKALQKLAIEADGFKDFREKASEIVDINRDQWLRVEMDAAIRGAVMGESWRAIEETKEYYPYWEYRGEMDDREREEHVALEGLVFRIGDPEGDAVFPPGDWSCRCRGESVDDDFMKENGKEVSKGSDYLEEKDEKGKDYVDPDFRFNPGKQTMPNDSSYFQVLPSANAADAELFDLDE